jgi:ankyrin repeat protein
VDVAKYLLEKGANVNVREEKGLTAKDFARKMNKKSIQKLLEPYENMK